MDLLVDDPVIASPCETIYHKKFASSTSFLLFGSPGARSALLEPAFFGKGSSKWP